MKKGFLQLLTVLALVLLTSASVFAQGTVTGTLADKDTEDGLISASVTIKGTTRGAITNLNGGFTINGVPAGEQILVVSYIGYTTKEIAVSVKDGQTTDAGTINLTTGAIGISEVEVLASIAVNRKTPVAVSTIDGIAIEEKLGNQEFPEILKSTPSVYTTKQGGGFGDARISVRGFSQENIALLINGISVSGMEDNKVYWSNWAGLGDVTRTMQVQRGLGASRMATSSVGATINIVTKTTDQEKGGSVFSSIGNDGYQKTGLTLSTGRTDDGWAFTFSGSRTTGDGYINGTYIDAWSYFGSIAKEIGKNQQLLFTIFGAPQRHGQRDFWHSFSDQEKYGTRWNDDFGYYQGENKLWRNNFYHKPQASLTHMWDISPETNIISSFYASSGRGGGTGDIGSQREYRISRNAYGQVDFDDIANWNKGLANNTGESDFNGYNYVTAGSSDTLSGRVISKNGGGIIERASMNEHEWFGLLSNVSHDLTDNLTLSGGIDLRWYKGSHYRKTIDLLGGDLWFDQDDMNNATDWVDINEDGIQTDDEMGNLVRPTNDATSLFGAVPTEEKIDYYNDEDINWYGLFAQLEYTEGALSAFLSGAFNYTQMRRYDFFNRAPGNQITDWINFSGGNAKIGANYNIDENSNVFVNAGYISRAPYFDALFPTYNNDEVNSEAINEEVLAFELGYGYRSNIIAANVNAYYTDWSNKTETISGRDANGNIFFTSLLGVNAAHMGLELDFNIKATDNLTFTGFAGLNDWKWKNNPTGTVTDENQNVLGEATYYIDGLEVGGAAQTTAGVGADWNIFKDVSLNVQYFYFDRLFANYAPDDVDTQGSAISQLDAYALVDAGLVWRFEFAGLNAKANVNVNNALDTEYISESNGSWGGWYGFGRTWNAGFKVYF
jgi:outer membrane cobalamin receptor